MPIECPPVTGGGTTGSHTYACLAVAGCGAAKEIEERRVGLAKKQKLDEKAAAAEPSSSSAAPAVAATPAAPQAAPAGEATAAAAEPATAADVDMADAGAAAAASGAQDYAGQLTGGLCRPAGRWVVIQWDSVSKGGLWSGASLPGALRSFSQSSGPMHEICWRPARSGLALKLAPACQPSRAEEQRRGFVCLLNCYKPGRGWMCLTSASEHF